MKLNGASDLVLRAMRAKLTLFKSVMFSNYQQKNELSVVSLRQLTCFHCSRMLSSLQPVKPYLLLVFSPQLPQNTAAQSFFLSSTLPSFVSPQYLIGSNL